MFKISLFDGEKLISYYRRHWSIIVKRGWWACLALVVGIILLNINFVLFSWLGWLFIAVGLLKLIRELILWYYYIYVVTDHRLIEVEQGGIFKRRVNEVPLGQIQNMSYYSQGPLQGLLNYGTLSIKTQTLETRLDDLPHPESVQHQLQQLINASKL